MCGNVRKRVFQKVREKEESGKGRKRDCVERREKENESREEKGIGRMKGGGKRERERNSERRRGEGDKVAPVQSC